ncbi:conserved protein of unknown function [Sterolibacterium denitrificans]|uniref:DUF2325 domain-containing protein n=1 Tax=Sterolibacterium denitrificans TaxID=157592 RepID=A0A7Z7HU03_9PROT|nr:DUF2325 domain-containing protein [Sterolibacterium denitrificans]SMB28650.1 conserved protein of unknown function [Sterolibacterium denitrificans]
MENHVASIVRTGGIGNAMARIEREGYSLAALVAPGGRNSAVRGLRDAGAAMKPFSLAFEKAFGNEDAPAALTEEQVPLRQRRRIWEMPSAWHCTLAGTCLSIADLRHLMKSGEHDDAIVGDYGLHSYIVNHCGNRNAITEEIHRLLNHRHAGSLRHFARFKGADAVLAAWKDAFAAGNIAGSLWAAWTHGDIGEYEGSVIYGDLHMLSHQLCAQAQPSQIRIAELEKDNGRQNAEILRLRQALASMRSERAQRVVELEGRVAELEGKLACARKTETTLAEAGNALSQNRSLRERNDLLNRRLAALEQRSQAQQNRITEFENELARARNATQRKLDPALASFAATASVAASAVEAAEATETACRLAERAADIPLGGRRILCIGGRPGLIAHYRRLVESNGGCFIHHDGGQEDNEHRIDAIVAGADVVFCQVGYLSHPAYWRIKEACKQRGLPCIFQKSGGITAFSRDLEMIAEDAFRSPQASPRTLFGQNRVSGYSA